MIAYTDASLTKYDKKYLFCFINMKYKYIFLYIFIYIFCHVQILDVGLMADTKDFQEQKNPKIFLNFDSTRSQNSLHYN